MSPARDTALAALTARLFPERLRESQRLETAVVDRARELPTRATPASRQSGGR